MQEIFSLAEDDSLLDKISEGEGEDKKEESISNSIEELDRNTNHDLAENLVADLEEDENNDFEAHNNFNVEEGPLPNMLFTSIDSLVKAYQEYARAARFSVCKRACHKTNGGS
ncbi:conserved hypothetical protein [Ricinus communis]|uniref:Uncharacterized protein n=1 Tax=Ricinus communis TaxID=3988 RepID=B9T7M9_RICCO|nr:conserved hypothetical protein [Ricinus communis]